MRDLNSFEFIAKEKFNTTRAMSCPHCGLKNKRGWAYYSHSLNPKNFPNLRDICSFCDRAYDIIVEVSSKDYGSHICKDGKERKYSTILCSICRGIEN